MNPISDTAYYCCGVRMHDAQLPNSLCNDHFAQRFMEGYGNRVFEPFKSERLSNLSCATRCSIVDGMVRSALQAEPDSIVISIGAGFDTRPYRLQGGRWYELDEAPLIELKNQRLPLAECANPITRINIDFAKEQLSDKLADAAALAAADPENPVIVVIEGVSMYLPQAAISSTLQALQRCFPKHVLICDMMTRRFARVSKGPFYDKIAATGATMAPPMEDPRRFVVGHGYAADTYVPHFDQASRIGALWRQASVPRPVAWLLGHVFFRAWNEYGVYRFEYPEQQ